MGSHSIKNMRDNIKMTIYLISHRNLETQTITNEKEYHPVTIYFMLL